MIKKIGAAAMAALMFMAISAGCARSEEDSTLNTMSPENIIEPIKDKDKVFNDVVELSYTEATTDTDYMAFVFDFGSECFSGTDDNVMVSPASLLFAMEMAGAGADGKTLDEMSNVMVPGASNEEALGFASDYYRFLNGTDEMNISNGIFMNSKFDGHFYSDYIDYIQDMFDAQTDIRPFNDDAVDYINEWVNESTDGMIPTIIDKLDPDLDMAVIINAIAFNGEWEEKYEGEDINEEGLFTNASGEDQTVTMLNSTEGIFFETEKATGFIKEYKGGEYAFVAILPKDESIDANEFMAGFTAEDYRAFIDSARSTDVHASLPAFSYDYSNEGLIEVLENMGMEAPFNNEADFSNMTDIDAYISSVIQKTHIEVDSDGTKAAAATAVTITAKGAIIEPEDYEVVRLNRPFAYVIVDTETDTPVFLGTVNSIDN